MWERVLEYDSDDSEFSELESRPYQVQRPAVTSSVDQIRQISVSFLPIFDEFMGNFSQSISDTQ